MMNLDDFDVLILSTVNREVLLYSSGMARILGHCVVRQLLIATRWRATVTIPYLG